MNGKKKMEREEMVMLEVLVVGWEFLELPGDRSNSWGSAVGLAEAGIRGFGR